MAGLARVKPALCYCIVLVVEIPRHSSQSEHMDKKGESIFKRNFSQVANTIIVMLCLFVLGLFALASAAPEPPVYRLTETPPSNGTLYPGNCEWGLEGCYNEPSSGRILQYVNSGKSLTVERCFQICAAFYFALVEFRSECWYGNIVNPAATQFTGEGTGCRLACAGNADQLCGGQSKQNTFIQMT